MKASDSYKIQVLQAANCYATRRFFLRPSIVLLVATGLARPYQKKNPRSGSIRLRSRIKFFTFSARTLESFRLYSSAPGNVGESGKDSKCIRIILKEASDPFQTVMTIHRDIHTIKIELDIFGFDTDDQGKAVYTVYFTPLYGCM